MVQPNLEQPDCKLWSGAWAWGYRKSQWKDDMFSFSQYWLSNRFNLHGNNRSLGLDREKQTSIEFCGMSTIASTSGEFISCNGWSWHTTKFTTCIIFSPALGVVTCGDHYILQWMPCTLGHRGCLSELYEEGCGSQLLSHTVSHCDRSWGVEPGNEATCDVML